MATWSNTTFPDPPRKERTRPDQPDAVWGWTGLLALHAPSACLRDTRRTAHGCLLLTLSRGFSFPCWGFSLQPRAEMHHFPPAPQRRAVIGVTVQEEKGKKRGELTLKRPWTWQFAPPHCSVMGWKHALSGSHYTKRDRPCTTRSQGLAQTHAVGCQAPSGLRFLP